MKVFDTFLIIGRSWRFWSLVFRRFWNNRTREPVTDGSVWCWQSKSRTWIPKSWLNSARATCLSSIFLLVFLMAWTEQQRNREGAGGSLGRFWCHANATVISLLRKTRWTATDSSTDGVFHKKNNNNKKKSIRTGEGGAINSIAWH